MSIDKDFLEFLYSKGYSLSVVSKLLLVPEHTLRKINKELGVVYKRQFSDLLTNNQLEIICKLYSEGKSQPEIGESFGVSGDTIWRVLKHKGIKSRDKNSHIYKHKNFNLDAFSDFSEETAAYFYGLMLADGCLAKNCVGKYTRLTISLKTTDEYILEKFLDYLRSDGKLSRRVSKDKRTSTVSYTSSIGFNNPIITKRFTDQGYEPRKSMREKAPSDILTNSRDFWRGMVDGDGCLGQDRGCFRLGLVGSKDITEAFLMFVTKNIKLITARTVKMRKGGLHTIDLSGDDARNVAKLLYEGSNIHLTRKYDKAKQFFGDKL